MMTKRSSSGYVTENLTRIREMIDEACAQAGRKVADVRLMAVTKTVETERVNEAISAGVKLLGENKAQELCAKFDGYEKDGVEIHFIGHLQTNKVRQIIDKVTMIQSLDSLDLAREIQRQCEKRGRAMDCLVEVNVGSELTKSGVDPDGLESFLESLSGFERLKVRGIMAIPPVCDSDVENERNFERLHKLFVDIRDKKIDNVNMDFLSMGMSGDFPLAIKHGSNLVRLGTILFGQRFYGPK